MSQSLVTWLAGRLLDGRGARAAGYRYWFGLSLCLPSMSSGRCSGASHSSWQRGASHRTVRCPLRAARAGGQSHGSHVTVTVSGRHGWCKRHSLGHGTLVMNLVEHSFDSTWRPGRLVRPEPVAGAPYGGAYGLAHGPFDRG